MLSPLHIQETQAAAVAASHSMSGYAVQLSDELLKLAKMDMRDAATTVPFEFAQAAADIRKALFSVLELRSLYEGSAS